MIWAWHVHHDKLVQYLTGPLEERIAYIKANKPLGEVELRLRLLKPVKAQEKLNSALAEYEKIELQARVEYEKIRLQAWVEYQKIDQQAWVEYQKIRLQAWVEYQKIEQQAWVEYQKIDQQARVEYEKIEQPVRAEYQKIEERLHAEECPNCPWDGKTIFPTSPAA